MQAETQRIINNLIREAVVFQVDYAKQRIKVKDDVDSTAENGWESGWLRFGTTTAGKNKRWEPPTIGEQVVVLSPGGDLSQGIVVASLFSDDNPANGSSDSETNWDIDGVLTISADNINFISADKVNINAPGNVNVAGDVIADTVSLKHHKNTGVMAGPVSSGEPEQ